MKIKQVKSQYTPQQIVQYLEHIKFPAPPSIEQITAGAFECTRENLALVVRRHLVTIPFENTDMHYNADHLMDVSPQGIFKRVVLDGAGKGSFCYGMNGLLLEALRGLGYRAYAAPARVNNCQPPSTDIDLTPAGHMVILVQPLSAGSLNSETFIVDVGFGGVGLARPIPLVEGAQVRGTAPPEEHRLVRGRHPLSSLERVPSSASASAGAGEESGQDQDPELEWRLEHRCGTYQPEWRVVYQFSLKESYQGDRESMAFATAGRPGIGPFWANVVVIAYFTVDGGPGDDLGRLVLLGGRIDRRIGDRSEKIVEIKDEVGRIRALRKYFGICVPEENVAYIRGRLAEL